MMTENPEKGESLEVSDVSPEKRAVIVLEEKTERIVEESAKEVDAEMIEIDGI